MKKGDENCHNYPHSRTLVSNSLMKSTKRGEPISKADFRVDEGYPAVLISLIEERPYEFNARIGLSFVALGGEAKGDSAFRSQLVEEVFDAGF